MRRWLAAPALLAAVVAAATFGSTSRTAAQDAKKIGSDPVDETIITGDGVSLQGKFYAAAKGGGDDPVVILLYSPATPGDRSLAGRDMTKGDWDAVVRTLRRRMDHAGDGERFRLLVDIGDIMLQRLGDREKAAKSYVAALDIRADDRNLLTKLMGVYSETKDWSRLVEVILRIAELDDLARSWGADTSNRRC